MDTYSLPRDINANDTSYMARASEMELFRKIAASSSAIQEPIACNRLDKEGLYKDNAIYRLSLSINDAFRISDSNLENKKKPFATPKQHRRASPKSMRASLGSPNRKRSSVEFLSIEQMDRLLKRRRRRNDQRVNYYRDLTCEPDEKTSKDGPLLRKGFSNANAKEYKIPNDLFVPFMGDGVISDTTPYCPSKFLLRPRRKSRAVESQRYYKHCGFSR